MCTGGWESDRVGGVVEEGGILIGPGPGVDGDDSWFLDGRVGHRVGMEWARMGRGERRGRCGGGCSGVMHVMVRFVVMCGRNTDGSARRVYEEGAR